MFRTAFCLVLLLAAPAWALENRLLHNPSPYLALHGTDPTAWQEWNAEAIERARKQNKLLFVSIGYFSCHWCHVMQRESYRNPDIARLLNDRFIPVKVDRELNGALDAEMQAFAEATRGRAGWPLNVFITPEGYPLVAILYAPPKDFLKILQRVDERWRADSAALKEAARGLSPEPPEPQTPEARFAPQVGKAYRQQLLKEAMASADTLQGGFGKANKFPQSPQLAALLDIAQSETHPQLNEFLRLTLDQMRSQGLYDPVGGGFFRYTIDPDWQTPHFEKMLYDNAQLALVYLRAAKLFKHPPYQTAAFATLDFLLEEMRDHASGALITSTSAVDEHNREGAYYLWQKDELQKLLSAAEYATADRVWRLDLPADFAFGYLPMEKRSPTEAERATLKAIYAKLKAARAHRSLPKDVKRITGLNGLALMAFAEAASTEPRYAAAARAIRDFLVRQIGPAGLAKGESQGVSLGPGDLEDYAYAAAGLLAYAEAAHQPQDRARARALVSEAWSKFHTARGWQLEQKPLLARPYYQTVVADNLSPSPAALLIESSWALGGKQLRTRALRALNTGYDILDEGVLWYATQVSAMSAIK